MNIFERIRYLRKDLLHMNQTDFGKVLGVSRSVIKNMELNVLSRPEQKEPIIKLICKEFHVSEAWLRTGEGDPFTLDLEEDEGISVLADIERNDPKMKQALTRYRYQMGIYERIRELRKVHLNNMTQEEFSKEIRISRSNLGNIETGKVSLTDRVISDICDTFHVDRNWLLTGEGDPFLLNLEEDEFVRYIAEIDRNDPRLKQAILDYKKLSEKDKELFWSFMDRFIMRQKEPED